MDINKIIVEPYYDSNSLKQSSKLNDCLKQYFTKNNNKYIEPEDIYPTTIKYRVSFDLINSNSGFANMIKRTIEDVIEVYSFSFDLEDFETNDAYILYNMVKQRLEALPIDQDILSKIKEDEKIQLKYTNMTESKQPLLTREIKISNPKNGEKIFDPNVILYGDGTFILSPESREYIGDRNLLFNYAYDGLKHKEKDDEIDESKYFLLPDLIPSAEKIMDDLKLMTIPDRSHMFSYRRYDMGVDIGKTVNISNIKIIKGTGKIDANAFALVGRIFYEIIDMEPYNMETGTGCKSINSNPRHFRIGYNTLGNIKPKEVILKTCEYLKKKFSNLIKVFEEIKSIPFENEWVTIKIDHKLIIITFIGEYWTIANVIAKYIFEIDKTVEYVAPAIVHPDIEKGVVKIKHKEPIEITKQSLKKIVEDINKLNEKMK